jgi:hypothetical protein
MNANSRKIGVNKSAQMHIYALEGSEMFLNY